MTTPTVLAPGIDNGCQCELRHSIMALLHEAVEEKKLDVRVAERNMSRGVITSEELQKAQDKLPDDSDNAQWVNIESLMTDESGDSNLD
jgi:hypothetical protein